MRRGWALYEISMRSVIDCEKPRGRTRTENIYFQRRMPRPIYTSLGTLKTFPEQIWSAIRILVIKGGVENEKYVLFSPKVECYFGDNGTDWWKSQIQYTEINKFEVIAFRNSQKYL